MTAMDCRGRALFCVGTTFLFSTEYEPSRGRIRLLCADIQGETPIYMALIKDTKGAVNALVAHRNLLLAGINSSVRKESK